jgi:SagB-type dehydrogenase family enzyme
MFKTLLASLYLGGLLLSGSCDVRSETREVAKTGLSDGMIQLPAPKTAGAVSLEQTIAGRRSVREYAQEDLSWEEIGQLLWAGQGVTEPGHGLRAAPSAGALYPIELYVVISEGIYHYLPKQHALEPVKRGDHREALYKAALSQRSVLDAPLDIVVTGVEERTRAKYGDRAGRYVALEAGHVCQNILLQAVALGLGGVPVGAFFDDQVRKVVGCPPDHSILYIVPVGKPRS